MGLKIVWRHLTASKGLTIYFVQTYQTKSFRFCCGRTYIFNRKKKSARPILHRIKKLEEHKSSCRGEHGVVENCLIEKISSCDSTLCNPYESLGHSARVIIVYNNDTIRLLNFDHSLKTQFDC